MKKLIRFGKDIIVGCAQMLSKTEIEMLCTTAISDPPLLSANILSHLVVDIAFDLH